MLKKYTDQKQQVILILQPNASLSWKGNLYILVLFLVSFMLITGVFVILGTWMILPFAGLELLLLALCLYLVNKQSHSLQVITLSTEHVKIEKGYRSRQHVWTFKRFFCRIYIKRSHHPWQNDEIQIGTHKQRVLVGEHLPLPEHSELIDILVHYVKSYEH